MRAICKTTLILAGLALAVPACGSDPAEDLAGEWAGKCTAQDGAATDATLSFGTDGKYTQKIAGADGGSASGTYTASDKTVTLTGPDGEALEADYSLNGDTLTITTPGSSADASAASTCELTRS
ncbi:MAG TPA: lipocalin family protein [Pseudonocardiaceae bacterium]|nr:lipocalin family protein [Pseudonocardiaceae bacterium]